MCGTLFRVGPDVQLVFGGLSPVPTGDTRPSWSVDFSIAWSSVTLAAATAVYVDPETTTPVAEI
jgi:hypothetical protein